MGLSLVRKTRCPLLWLRYDRTRTNALSSTCWCGACLGGSKSNAINLILKLFLYHFLHTISSWCHESIHNNTNNQQTPPPWWWSCLPLQQRGFNESTPSEWRAALCIHFLRPLLKGLVEFNKNVEINLFVSTCMFNWWWLVRRQQWWPKRHPLSSADSQNIVID